MLRLLLFCCVAGAALGNITGSTPVAGDCLCLDATGVNVRDSACGNVIGSANPPQCYTAVGQKVGCTLSGIWYEFHAVEFGGTTGWMAGDYLVFGNAAQCASGGGPGVCADVQQVSRSEWGARPPAWAIDPLPSKPVGMGFVHHTVTAFCYTYDECVAQMKSIQNYHMDSLGWPDIGYNFLVGEDGRAYEGRGWDKIGAHTYGYNDIAVAVSMIGDFTSRVPNDAALAALNNIFNCAIQQGILASNYEMFGHRDAGCTACPGDSLYPLIQTWPQYSWRTIPYYCLNDGQPEYP